METTKPVEWKQTEPGIWTRVPDGESAAPKRPARKIASLTAAQLPLEPIRKPGKRRVHPVLHVRARS